MSYGPTPTTTTTTPTTTTPTTTTTTTTTATTTTTTTTAPPGAGCTATTRVASSWQGGFQAEVTVTNRATAPSTGWTVSWTTDAAVTSLWNGRLAQSGRQVSVEDVGWNGALAPGASATFGYTANGSASTPESTCRTR
ncbi:cellulose binding domain-containing protein [Saccharothrix lopnurensis]|uniref:Cellulose binding domain-containing protein n=1 Tax=Saccharothrix lopnurensis TaxID=1670621 RepID=A0ABW1P068_9PSEU